MERYNDIIPTFFEEAERENIDFNLTLSISHPFQGEPSDIISEIARQVKSLMGRIDSSKWLTTPTGRIILYTWLPDGLALGGNMYDIVHNPSLMADVAAAYKELGNQINADVVWMYDLHYAEDYPEHTDYVDAALDYFPAVKGWVNDCNNVRIWDYVAAQCDQRGRTLADEVYGDFATGKLFRQEPPKGGIYSAGAAENVQPGQVDRWDKVLDLSANFRNQLELINQHDAEMVSLTTWNDYAEGHHVAPEINHNFGFAQLLQYYLAQWRDQPAAAPSDVAIAFFRKYPWGITPDPFDLGARVDTPCVPMSEENTIEVVTILDAPGQLQVNGSDAGQIGSGLDVTRVPMETGHVGVTVTRDGSTVAEFTTPESITDQPFRRDRLMFSFSSEHDRLYSDIYGADAPVMVSNQYATQNLADGPNFGTRGDDAY